MEDNKKIQTEEAEDERLHNQFIVYFLTALRRRKAKYLMKYYEHQRMVTSLDELMDRQEERCREDFWTKAWPFMRTRWSISFGIGLWKK